MDQPHLSARFLEFLVEYAARAGKDPARIIEEAVAQSILRHSSPEEPSPHDSRVLAPTREQRRILDLFPDMHASTQTDTPFGMLLERLPDRNWTYQVCRLEEWWFVLISEGPDPVPEPAEVRSIETSQAYVWLFRYTKSVRLWSGPNRFLVVF